MASVESRDTQSWKQQLQQDGYAIIHNVLDHDEVKQYYKEFKSWQASIPNHDYFVSKMTTHGIYKYHQAGNTRHAWLIRTNPKIRNIFATIWGTDELTTSMDGCCYIAKNESRSNKCWTHTDQAPAMVGKKCIQGLVALTDNKERTLVVYKGSHTLHQQYFESIEPTIDDKDKSMWKNNAWQLIDQDILTKIKQDKIVLHIPAGSVALWDSRTFHQNQYGKPESEERIVQYVCYLPKHGKGNTTAMKNKRQKYFETLRTTSHWPYPIKVNSEQPFTRGDDRLKINYEQLKSPYLEDLLPEIKKII